MFEYMTAQETAELWALCGVGKEDFSPVEE